MVEHITIKKSRDDGCWLATSDNPQVKDLFGTDTLPTPFLLSMPAADVVVRLEVLNPEVVVDVEVAL